MLLLAAGCGTKPFPTQGSALALTPRVITLLPGQTQQFSTVAAGSALQFEATGGAITSSGLYTAGSTEGVYRVVAKDDDAQLADTAEVTISVTAPAPVLEAVVLSPASATVASGATQQFTSEGIWSDGHRAALTPSYTATGGTITAGGLYTAGASAGTFRVIAQDGASGLADTAAVTVTVTPPPPTGTASCDQEPAGMTRLIESSWEAVPPALPSRDAQGWGHEYPAGAMSILQDATAPRSPNNVLRTRFAEGFGGGSAPADLEAALAGNPTTVYVCMWVKRSANWDDNGNAGTKHFFLFTPYGGTANYTHVYIAMTGTLQHYFGLESGNQSAAPNIDYYGPQDDVGTWRKYEYLFVSNTPGSADGTFTAWKNGVQFMRRTGIRYFPSDATPAFNHVQWSPTYGGGLNPVPEDMYIDIDHWYISGKR